MMHPFRQFIHQYVTLSNENWLQIERHLEQKTVEKDTIVLAEGRICRHLYFLESGLLRFFTLKNGEEVTKYFTDIPYCFTSQKSFNTRQPAKESIETLEDSVIWQMSYEAAHALLALPVWSTFIRKLVQEVQELTEEIMLDLQTETAENRYKKMLLDNDPLLQRVPLRHLASYLGIAPQSLSRIRKSMLSKRS
jgi:CRP-like cAMP-binding protein